MISDPHRAIIVIGAEEPTEALLAEAERYEEVFVVARRVPDPSDRWVVDDDRAEAAARGRLARAVARLRGRGVRAVGAIGDQDLRSAREDARAAFPTAVALPS
jgi:DNA-binding LacI/PurR family transcriptional regulator